MNNLLDFEQSTHYKPKQFTYLKHFEFLNLMVDYLSNRIKQEDLVQEICTSGSRKSGKTYQIIYSCVQSCIAAMKYNKKIAIYILRKENKDIVDLIKETENVLANCGLIESIHYKYSKPNKTAYFEFSKHIWIWVRGVKTKSNDKESLKGLSGTNNYDVITCFGEEITEFTYQEWRAVNYAVRGAKDQLFIMAGNPDNFHNWYVQYCNKRLPYNLETLKTQYVQKAFIEEISFGHSIKKVFIYSNWLLNKNNISYVEQAKMEESRKFDPVKATVWYWGYYGSEAGAVFSHYLDITNQNTLLPTSNYTQFTAGIDVGYSNSPSSHPTTCSLWALTTENYKNIALKIAELEHNNSKQQYLDFNQIAQKIVKWYTFKSSQYPLLTNGLTVKVDYGSGGLVMINILNDIAQRMAKSHWLKFVPVEKKMYYEKDRIQFTQAGMSQGFLRYNWKELPKTYESYSLMEYQENSRNELKLKPLNEDHWDSDMYALMEYAEVLLETANTEFIKFRSTKWDAEYL